VAVTLRHTSLSLTATMEDSRMTFDMSLAPRNGYVISIGTSEVNTEIESRAVTLFGRNGTYRRSVIKAYICMIFTGNIQDMEDKAFLEQDVTRRKGL